MRRGFFYALIVGMLFFSLPAPAADKAATDTGYLGVGNEWIVQVDGDILPITDSAFDIGASGSEVANIYADTLYVGGVAYTSFAAGSDGNWTDNGATVTLDGNPTGVILTKSTGDLAITSVTAGSVILENAAAIDNAADGTVTLVEGGDTLSLIFSGSTIQLDSSDGGFQFAMSSAGEGYVDFLCNNDTNDYLRISTVSNVPTIVTAGTCNLEIAPDGGTTTVTGALTATGLATAAGVTSSTTVTLQNGATIVNSTDNIVQISEASGATLSVMETGDANADATLLLRADNSTDNGDDWQIVSDGATNSLFIQNDTSGSMATKLTLSTAGVTTLTGGLTLSNAEVISNATDTIVRVASSGTTESTLEVYATGTSDDDAIIRLTADADANAGDRMAIVHDGATNSMFFQSDTDVADTLATILTLAKTGLITTTGDIVVAGTTPLVTIGDAGNEDAGILFDGQTTKDFYISTDNADDTLIVGVGSAVGTDARIQINDDADNTTITVGDGANYDMALIFNGASTADYYIAYDHASGLASTCLTLGVGSAVGTTPVLGIDTSSNLILADKEYITDASDVIGIWADDGICTVKMVGFENYAATLQLIADQDDDATDGWQIAANDSAIGTLTIGNDSSVAGTIVTKATLSSAGALTLTGGILTNTTAHAQGMIACGYVNNGYSAM